MIPPEGLTVGPNIVCKLHTTLYGLKQDPREWNKSYDNFAKTLGFVQSTADRCLYVRDVSKNTFYLFIFVGDIILVNSSLTDLQELKKSLMCTFKMRDSGVLNYFLVIKIRRSHREFFINQGSYLRKLLSKLKMGN